MIYVTQIAEKYNYIKQKNKLNPIIGEYDDPANQRQDILTLPITEGGNTAIYGMAGSGKSNVFDYIMLFIAGKLFARRN